RLLASAERGQLTNPAILVSEVRRMLADPRATDALVDDFAAQWLNLRRVAEVVVDPDRYPNYDLSLLQAFQRETELFVGSTIRERLAQHRQSPSCNICHSMIDPLGFALENFDVIGGWRTVDESGKPVDASGTTLSGAKVEGLAGLRALLLDQPEQFPRTVTEKLLAYALGRRLEDYDRPAVRKIVRDAAAHDYRWSSLILGIAESPTFLMRSSHPAN